MWVKFLRLRLAPSLPRSLGRSVLGSLPLLPFPSFLWSFEGESDITCIARYVTCMADPNLFSHFMPVEGSQKLHLAPPTTRPKRKKLDRRTLIGIRNINKRNRVEIESRTNETVFKPVVVLVTHLDGQRTVISDCCVNSKFEDR